MIMAFLENQRATEFSHLLLVRQKLFSEYTGVTPASLEVERIFVVRPICGQTWALTF